MVPGEQAGVVLVGPADAECVVAAEGDVDQTKVDRDAFWVQQLLAGELVDAHRATAVLTDLAKRQLSDVVVIPDKFQHALLFVDSNVLW